MAAALSLASAAVSCADLVNLKILASEIELPSGQRDAADFFDSIIGHTQTKQKFAEGALDLTSWCAKKP
jgi:hypothetical protein